LGDKRLMKEEGGQWDVIGQRGWFWYEKLMELAFGSLEGTLVESDGLSAIVEINEIGYSVNIPLSVSCKLPAVETHVKLQIYPVYREGRQELYGFFIRDERDFLG
jgi:hypothetical protein